MFSIRPVDMTVYYNGNKVARNDIELSYSFAENEATAETIGVYTKEHEEETWLCDCKNREVAEMVVAGLRLLQRLSKEGPTKNTSANALAFKAEVLADSAGFLADIAEVLCTK